MALSTGCAGKGPILAWQNSLEQYVRQEGHGDPNILRDTRDLHSRQRARPARITFGKLDVPSGGAPPFVEFRDVNGVLLDQRKVGPNHWYFFLVGVVKPRGSGIEDVRLVAFSPGESELKWKTSPPDPKALSLYLASLPNIRQSSLSDRMLGALFPPPTDVYRLDITGDRVTVIENRSGVVWRLRLQDEIR
jgi:hypothetical protein